MHTKIENQTYIPIRIPMYLFKEPNTYNNITRNRYLDNCIDRK